MLFLLSEAKHFHFLGKFSVYIYRQQGLTAVAMALFVARAKG